ncbi:hypothetical protein [Arcobacter sp.]|uniref:hypothetical protein n=1 Tax=Arcobacter sp. TaxID=1872629 RepID=UPI003C71E03D
MKVNVNYSSRLKILQKDMRISLIVSVLLCSTTFIFADSNNNELNTISQSNKETKDNSSELRIFGAGERLDDKTYSGMGIEYKDDNIKTGIEYGNDYNKLYGVYKYALPKNFYLKGGVGYLNKEIPFNSELIDIKQYTLGTSLGYGDDSNYNIEIGYLGNKLSNAYDANGYTNTVYVETLAQYEMDYEKDWGTLEAVGTYQNSHLYHKNYSGMIVEAAYYPIEDIRTSVQYDDAQVVDENNYRVILGVKYAFASQKWSPIFKATANTSNSVSYGLVYDEDIENEPLSNRDFFENQIGTGTLKAQELASSEFNQRIQKSLNRDNNTNTEKTSVPNTKPTGESFTVNIPGNGFTKSVDLASHIQDADGDTLTVIYVGSGVIRSTWGSSIQTSTISGTIATLSISTGSPPGATTDAYLEYKVFDGKEYSPVYRLTITNFGI